jgi:transposase-like protein
MSGAAIKSLADEEDFSATMHRWRRTATNAIMIAN